MLDHLSLPEAPGQRYLGGEVPESQWEIGDDECDCVFQRIGDWTNPHIGRTMRVRICCIFSEIYKDYPQFVQEIPAYFNWNTKEFEAENHEWNGETDMPRAFWYRQLAAERGESIDAIREKFKDMEPPKGIPRPPPPPVVQQRTPMSEHEVIGRQLMLIEELEQNGAWMVGVMHALKNGELDMDRIKLHDNGFSVEEEAVV